MSLGHPRENRMFSKLDSDFQNCSHMNFYALSWENQCSHQKCNHTFSSLNPLPEAFTCQLGLDSQEKRGTTGEERIFKKSFFGERKNSQNKDSEIGNFYVPTSFFFLFSTCWHVTLLLKFSSTFLFIWDSSMKKGTLDMI